MVRCRLFIGKLSPKAFIVCLRLGGSLGMALVSTAETRDTVGGREGEASNAR